MVTIPDFEGPFESLLLILEDNMAPVEDRVDAYLRLIDRLREEEEVFVKEILRSFLRIVMIFKKDTHCDKPDLCQASLQALGHCLYQEQIASAISIQDGQDLVQGILMRIKDSDDKGVCTRALWCLAKQNLDSEIISSKLGSILISLELVLGRNLQSVTVDHEVLCVIQRLLEQLPKGEMIKRAESWVKIALPFLGSSASKVRERCLAVLTGGLEHMISAQDKITAILVPLLKQSLIDDFSQMCSDKKELFVLKVWCCIVPVLGENLHKGGSLINNLLKLVEQGFRVPVAEVQVMAFSAWTILIDNFALSLDVLCAPKRIKLIMTPFLNLAVKERNETVEAARLSTWWHFVCLLGPKLLELFDQVCTPLLHFIFGTSIDQVSSMKNREGFGDLKCPPTPTNVKLLTEIMNETPKASVRRSLREMGTPRTPTVLNASFAKTAKQKLVGQGCEILAELLKPEHEVERLKTGTFKRPEDFKKYASLLINATKEGFKVLGKDLAEPLGARIWSQLVKRIGDLLQKGRSPDYGELLLPLLAVMQDFVDGEVLKSSLAIKMLEELSILPASVLSHHMVWLHSKDNHQGSVALLLVQLLFEPTLLANIWNCERFHVTFEHLINCGMTTTSGQLFYMKTVLALLEKAASIVSSKDTLWRLWSCVVDQLNKHILKTNDVNQGDVLEHDFSTLYLALTFPFRYLLDANLPQGTGKDVGKAVTELYRSFSRAAALVSTAEINVCSEELCSKLLSIEGDWTVKDIAFIDTLVILTGAIITCLDFSPTSLFAMTTTAAGKSPNTTPTKWNRQSSRPLGNFTSMVSLIGKLLSACERPDKCQDSAQTLGILTAVVTNLIDKMSYLFLHISGTVTITALLKTLAPSLAPFIENSHTSTKVRKSTLDKRLFTSRLIQKIEKLWTDVVTCVQSRHCGPYNSDFLAAMSPLLEVTLFHPKRNIKNHAVMFWNATFAHAQWLNYPETLRPALQAVKDKMSLTLPGWQNMEVLAKESELENESLDLTQHTDLVKPPLPCGIGLTSPQRRKTLTLTGGSPQLLKGSFLHKAASAEKAVENLSPKIVRSPKLGRPRNSSATTHARRKLPLSKYDDDDDQEYVMIAPSPKKKRLLTEHQKEVMCSRREVPAFYNALDQSQDGTQLPSQFSVVSSAVTPDPSQNSISEEVEEGKDFKFDPIKERMIIEDTSAAEGDVTLLRVEKPGCQESDQQQETRNKESGSSLKEVDEVIYVDWEEIKQESSEEKEDGVHGKTAESDSDLLDIESMNVSGDDEGEVTSPDVIPSSQTPSLESPFQSLRRVTIPLKSFLPPSFPLLVNKEEIEKKEVECEATMIAGVFEVEKQNKRKLLSANKHKVSPVACRTRRKLLQKTSLDRKSSVEQPAVTVSSLSKEEKQVTEKPNDEACAEKAVVPTSTVTSRHTTSSPVPSPINKFLRPLAAGGSPSRVAFRGMSSPGVSPSNGILKRWPGVKQSVDSPSPPGKVRRVSFALPVKDGGCSDVCRETLVDSVTTALHQKPASSSLFTAVKQRRPVSANSEQSMNDAAECMYPELVSCSLPVEQILPTIVSMSWSRGLGHLVRAQNIHTIGNLSALKEEQVNNLPIRSPKVQTLKKALKKFHHTQKGRNVKKVGTKSSPGTLLREDRDEALQFTGEAAVQKDAISCEAVLESQVERMHCIEPLVEAPVEEIVPNMDCQDNELSNDMVNKTSGCVVGLDEDDTSGLQVDPFQRESLEKAEPLSPQHTAPKQAEPLSPQHTAPEQAESLTPQHTKHDCGAVAAHMATPHREIFSLPTKLFSKEEEQEEAAKSYTGVDYKSEENSTRPKTVDNVVKGFKIHDANIDFVRDLKSTIQEVSEQCDSESEREGVTDAVCLPKGVDVSDKEKFCEHLHSLKNLASPDVLHGLSSEEIFEAHHTLSEVMSLVVQALRSRWHSTCSNRNVLQ